MTHGYEANIGNTLNQLELNASDRTPQNPVEAAENVVSKIRSCIELAQSTMAHAQQRQQEIHDRKREPAPRYALGSKVWLDVRNVKTDPARKKKLSEQHQ
jgi:hypothetical protein